MPSKASICQDAPYLVTVQKSPQPPVLFFLHVIYHSELTQSNQSAGSMATSSVQFAAPQAQGFPLDPVATMESSEMDIDMDLDLDLISPSDPFEPQVCKQVAHLKIFSISV